MKLRNIMLCTLVVLGSAVISSCGSSKKSATVNDKSTIYNYSVEGNMGGTINMKDYRGKVIMVVNTASKCGFTPQYEGLEALYEKYQDQGLVIVGFPCDQFGHQEPGTNEEIATFCKANYGVSFPIATKIEVNGENAHPIYNFLKARTQTGDIRWNFCKFLIARDGTTVKRYSTKTTPAEMEEDIQELLQ